MDEIFVSAPYFVPIFGASMPARLPSKGKKPDSPKVMFAECMVFANLVPTSI